MKKADELSAIQDELLRQLNLKIVPRNSIDVHRWDDCVRQSVNESPFGYSWVLDDLSPEWHGLILGDYIGVMPLPVVRQFGFLNIQMPQEVISLGIFSPDPLIINLFPFIFHHPSFSSFKFINYNGSPSEREIVTFNDCRIKQTFELNLSEEYKKNHRAYSNTHRRNIKAFHNSGLKIDMSPLPNVFTTLIKEVGAKRPEIYILPKYRKRLEIMTTHALERNMGETYSVWKNNKLIGGAFFLKGHRRVILYHLANLEGKMSKASFAIIDLFIKKHSGQNIVLDFAGSILPNVATFNYRFGARPVPYCAVTINRLPQPLKMAKDKNLLFKLKRSFGR